MDKIKTKINQIIAYIKAIFKGKSSIKISLKDKINLLEQFSNLLNSGITLTNSAKIIIYQTKNKKIKKLLLTILDSTNKGVPLKESLGNFPKIFTNFDLSIVEMGEVTGKLGDSIETIKLKEEKSRELKNKIIGALIYPMVISVLAIGMVLVFMIYVIPKIKDMYSDAKVNLPALTQNVIAISEFLQNNLFQLFVGLVIFIILFISFKNGKRTKIYFDNMILRVPLFGPLIKKKILSLFTASLGTLLQSGIMINKSIEISSTALENDYYEKALKEVSSGISKGVELSSLMGIQDISSGKENFLFPIELSSIVKIGEQTGKMPSLLLKLSVKYNKEIDNIVKNLQTAIEPIVIVLVGIIVGTLIMAIMLPFFNMVNVI